MHEFSRQFDKLFQDKMARVQTEPVEPVIFFNSVVPEDGASSLRTRSRRMVSRNKKIRALRGAWKPPGDKTFKSSLISVRSGAAWDIDDKLEEAVMIVDDEYQLNDNSVLETLNELRSLPRINGYKMLNIFE